MNTFLRTWFLLLVWLVVGTGGLRAGTETPLVPIPPGDQILKTLRKEHPRLLATAADFQRLRELAKSDAQVGQWRQQLERQAERILSAPPSQYEIPDGLRLLSTSRRVLGRIQTLGLLYQLDGDRRYVERAWKELDAAAHFKDWNPRHFLDTAEMTHAFAIGYDWMHAAWTPEQRSVLREALLEKGLKIAIDCYRGTARYGWWMRVRHNWNQVCNGGIGMGALAVADEVPELAGEFLHQALESLQLPMAEFAPDGAWNEGPGYWSYATTYNMAILAGLQSALGTDFGLSRIPGFAEAGMFPIYATGPLGRTFNYADAGDGGIRAPHLFWMARQFGRPVYAAYQRPRVGPHPLDLVWYDPKIETAAMSALPLDKYFRSAEVATLRSGWADGQATFVGFKAGDNKANHSHLDLGTFVLDALGARWVVDLGADDYNLPGYFGGQRWNYYRLRAEGHNTLVLNPGTGPDQDPKAATRIVRFETQPARAFAIADLTPAYAKHARSVRRGVALLERRQVVVQDEVSSEQACEVWWFLHTPAQAQTESATAVLLTQGNARLRARLLGPPGATFEVREAEPLASSPHPEKQAGNARVRKLAIHAAESKDLRLTVLLTPLKEGEVASGQAPLITPLEKW
jgi:hypothetical protein